MAQATDQIKVYALLIKNHVNLNGNQSQEVIDFYNKLNLKDDNTIKEFDKFIRNNDNQTKLGCEVVKASKGKGKYLRVNMQVFKIFLSNNNIPLDGGVDDDEAIDGATSDVEAIDGAAPDDDLGPAQKRCRRESQTIYSESYIQKQYYKEIFPNIKLIQEQLINLFDIFENDHLKKNVMEFTFKRFIKDFGCFDNLAIIEIYPKVMQGLNQFFNLIKEKYPGTIPTEVNKVKKAVVSVVQQYSQLNVTELKRIFPDVKWISNEHDDADATDTNMPFPELQEGDINHSDSDSDSDIGSDAFSSDSDFDEVEDARLQKVTSTVFSRRKKRKDFVDLTVANTFWHEMSNLDTNTHGDFCIVCKKGDEIIADYHQRRVQVYATENLHEMFLRSSEYLQHIDAGRGKIGLSLFKRAKCRCIKNDHMRSCADTVKVGMKYAIKAINSMLRSQHNTCQCLVCLEYRESDENLFKNERSLLKYLLCPEKIYQEIKREAVDNKKRTDTAQSNLDNAKIKFDPSLKSYSSHIPGSALPSLQQEVYTNYSFACSHFHCSECGISRLNSLNNCELLNNDILEGYIWEYSKELRVNSDEKERKELIKSKKSFKSIYSDLKTLLLKYIPHVWQTRNDDFMRKLLLEDGIGEGTVVIHTDFSAVLPLLSQNSECCHHPSNCLQDVFVISYKNGDVIINDAYHFWGNPSKVDGNKLKSNTAYHNACLRSIIQELKDNGRQVKVLYVLSDGCAAQYKNISNIFSMTSYCDDYDLDYLIHTFAPTSNFKCCCDACGADTKRWYRKAEMDEKDRCSDALQCYLLLANYMPQPRQARENLMMKLHTRHHRFVCTAADEEVIRDKLNADYLQSNVDKRNNLVVVDDDAFYLASKMKTLDGITKFHQIHFEKKSSNNRHVVRVRNASCWCSKCLARDFNNCLLKCDAGRNLETKQLQDEDSSYVLTFFGKDGGKNRLLSVENWKKLKGDNIIVVGLDLNNGDIQLAIMVSRPEKATAEQEFKVSNYTTTLLKDTYYFPIQLLVKVDIKRSSYVPNCYLSMPQILKAPLHCIVPPYLNQGEVRYANNGKEKMNFTNYIKCKTQVITSSSGAMNCIVIDNSDLRYLKSNAR